jgi:hypothetical protein
MIKEMSLLSECSDHQWVDDLSNKEKIELIEALLPDEKDPNERAYWSMILNNLRSALSNCH